MKQLLLLLFLMPLGSFAQNWFPDGAIWHYNVTGAAGAEQGYMRHEVTGDTIVDGNLCRKITRFRSTYYFPTDQYFSSEPSPLLVREADGIIWIYAPINASFDTLYNMNAVPGDRWQLAELPSPAFCVPESWIEVIDTSTITIQGMPLAQLAVEYHYVNQLGDTTLIADTITERIGSIEYLLPHDLCNGFIDGQQAGRIRCYQDLDISYAYSSSLPCDFIVGLEDLAMEKVSIYPNPGNSELRITVDANTAFDVRIKDATGSIVISTVSTGSIRLDTGDLAAGIYMVEVKNPEGRRIVKWVKR